jgi:hypothetical protein
MTHWLAVGDETGQWDKLEHHSGKEVLGVALVLIPLDRWQQVMDEPFQSSTLGQVLGSPAPGLVFKPGDAMKMQHHARDVLLLFRDTRKAEDPGVTQLQGLLTWLHGYPHLITVGAFGSAAAIHDVTGVDDQAHALGYAYALSLAPLLPFLRPDDKVHLWASGRSEDSKSSVVSRYKTRQSGQAPQSAPAGRSDAPFRSIHAGIAQGISHLDKVYAFPGVVRAGNAIKVLHGTDLSKLAHKHAGGVFLDMNLAGSLADLGATLMQMRHPDAFNPGMPDASRFPMPPLAAEGNSCFTPISEIAA